MISRDRMFYYFYNVECSQTVRFSRGSIVESMCWMVLHRPLSGHDLSGVGTSKTSLFTSVAVFLFAGSPPFGCHFYEGLSGQGPVTLIIDFLAILDY